MQSRPAYSPDSILNSALPPKVLQRSVEVTVHADSGGRAMSPGSDLRRWSIPGASCF